MKFRFEIFVLAIALSLVAIIQSPSVTMVAASLIWLLWRRAAVAVKIGRLIPSLMLLMLASIWWNFCSIYFFAASTERLIFLLVKHGFIILLFSYLACRKVSEKYQKPVAQAMGLASILFFGSFVFLTPLGQLAKKVVQLHRSPFQSPAVVLQGGAPGYLNHHDGWALDLLPLTPYREQKSGHMGFRFNSFEANSLDEEDEDEEDFVNPCYGREIVLPINQGIVRSLYQNYEDDPRLKSKDDDSCGNFVTVDSLDDHGPFTLRFCHLKKDSVTIKPQQIVRAGERLGLCGHSGNSSTPHLHLEAFRTSEKNNVPFSVNLLKGWAADMRRLFFGDVLSPQVGDLIP